MSHEAIAEWEGFMVALVGACAVLAGLVFVAVTMNLDRILPIPGLVGRAGESVILFVSALCQCAFVLIPHQSSTALGVELIVSGLLTWAVLTSLVARAVRAPNRQPRSWHLTRLVSVLAATVPGVIAGCALLGWLDGGLFWLAAGVLASVLTGTANSWVLLVEVVRDERYRPVDARAGESGAR